MIFSEYLINYGILGIWTISLLYDKYIERTKTNLLLDKLHLIMIKINTKMK